MSEPLGCLSPGTGLVPSPLHPGTFGACAVIDTGQGAGQCLQVLFGPLSPGALRLHRVWLHITKCCP